jgi:hypothetical protein
VTHLPRRFAFLTLFAVAVLPLVSGCIFSPGYRAAAVETRIEHAIDLLKTQADADSLAAAGLLSLQKHPDQSLALIARATVAAPERPELLWLHISMCREENGCNPEPLERRLRVLDAQNAAGWLGELARARHSTDDAALVMPLTAISRSQHLDIYWTSLITSLSRATANTRASPPDEATVTVIGLLAAQTIPAYQALSNACKGERLSKPEALEVCRGVAKSLMNGDTYLTEMIGAAIAKRVWPEGSAELKAAAEAPRIYEYQTKVLFQDDAWIDAHMGEYLTFCAQNRREQDVYKALLIARGKSPLPPPI